MTKTEFARAYALNETNDRQSREAGPASGIAALVASGAIRDTIICGATDSRWHECGHGTAFKTPWLNAAVFQIASFMVLREPIPTRWSHARHHTDSIIVGRDPEIAFPRPPDILGIFLNIFVLKSGNAIAFKKMVLHAAGRLTDEERSYIPESEHGKVYRVARIWLAIYAVVIAAAVITHSILPLMYVGLPSFFGAWFIILVEPDTACRAGRGRARPPPEHPHRLHEPDLPVLYLYMKYHVEHHMFPSIRYHALPRLHELMKADTPASYPSILADYLEIIPTLARQARDSRYFVVWTLPTGAAQMSAPPAGGSQIATVV